MTWLIWRQHRNQAFTAAAVLAAFTALMLVTGLSMASQYHAALASCAAAGTCGQLNDVLFQQDKALFVLAILTVAVPALLGMFWGAPLVARELETGTSQFVWMQSVTRRRWFTVTAGWILLAGAAWGAAISALVTWWSGPKNAISLDRFTPPQFDIQGIVPVAYAVFAVALGIAAGTVLRRALPALAATIGIFAALRFAVAGYLRPHYMTPVTTIYSLGHPAAKPSGAMWGLSDSTLVPNGHVFPGSLQALVTQGMSDLPAACRALVGQGKQIIPCLGAHGFRAELIYQPASRYWAFQGIEAAIYIALAAMFTLLAARLTTRRDA
jgi:hypothetical protein